MSKTIKIGTQESQLSLWQANTVKQMLEKLGHKIEIIPLKSIGNFAQVLDNAILHNKIDIAVHSLNDVSTILPDSIVQAAVLKRGNFKDVLVFKNNEEFLSQRDAVIAVGNPRHRAQWLNRYPTHTIVNLSGDLNTQLQKLEDNNDWNAAIFSAAALGRLGL